MYNKNRQAVWNWFILKFNFVFSKFKKRYFHIWFRITTNKIKPSFKNTIPQNLNLLELLNEADKTFLLPDFDIDFFIFDGSLELCMGETISRKKNTNHFLIKQFNNALWQVKNKVYSTINLFSLHKIKSYSIVKQK